MLDRGRVIGHDACVRSAREAARCFIAMTVVAGVGTGCNTDPCHNIDGPGHYVHVWWNPADLPGGMRYRLCVDQTACVDVFPHATAENAPDAGPYRAVVAQAWPPRAKVRFELLNSTGRVSKAFRGEADLTGHCFKSATFRANSDGTMTLAAVGDLD